MFFMTPSVHCFNQSIVNTISRTVILFIGRILDMCLGMFAAMFRKCCRFFLHIFVFCYVFSITKVSYLCKCESCYT